MIEFLRNQDKKSKIIFGMALVAIAAISVYLLFSPYSKIFYDVQKIDEVIKGFGVLGPLAYIGLMVLQILFAPIPGHFVYLAGGYLFGVVGGTMYGLIGLTLGSFIGISIGRFFGRPLVESLVGKKNLEKFDEVIYDFGLVAIFILFLFPGPPDDVFCLLAGLTDFELKKILVAIVAGRTPGLLAMVLAGESLAESKFLLFIIIIAVVAIISVLVLNYRKEIMEKL